MRNAFKISVGNPQGNKELGRCRYRLEMDLRDMSSEEMD
jgi:hypothetical protein